MNAGKPEIDSKYDIAGMEIKPEFCLKWYKNEDRYSDGNIEDEIIDFILKSEPEEYSKVIYEHFTWPTFYHLTQVRQNILNWYPFREEASVLEIGCGLGAITGLLCDRCKSVTAVELSKRRATAALLRHREKENLKIIVGNLNDIQFEEKFDYITLIGVLEYQGNFTESDNPFSDFLKTISQLLKPDGNLLIAIENKYGAKYWCGAKEDHTGIPFDGLNQYELGNKNAATFSKKELEELLHHSGYEQTYFYYPMPDYKLPSVVYSQEYLPRNGNMLNMNPYYIPNGDTLVIQEKKLYDDLIENNVFEFFSNSFLVECSKTENQEERVIFAALNSARLPDYQTGTLIRNDGTVKKIALKNREGIYNHIKQIVGNSISLRKNGLNTATAFVQDNMLIMNYESSRTLEEELLKLGRENNAAKIEEYLEVLMEQIENSSEALGEEKNIIYELGIDTYSEENRYGKILKLGYLDMIPRNCFVKDGSLLWYDQEWKLDAVPAKYIMYRCLKELYNSHRWLNRVISCESIQKKFDMVSYWNKFEALEAMFVRTVMDVYYLSCADVIEKVSGATYASNIKKLLAVAERKLRVSKLSKEQARADIEQLCQLGMENAALQFIKGYTETFGKDEEIEELRRRMFSAISTAIICINCSGRYMEELAERLEEENNIELYSMEAKEHILADIYDVISNTTAECVIFLEENQILQKDYLFKMTRYLHNHDEADTVVCYHYLIAEDGSKIAEADLQISKLYENDIYDGNVLLQTAFELNANLWGSLSTIMVRRQALKDSFIMKEGTAEEETEWLLFLCLLNKVVGGVTEELVASRVRALEECELERRCSALQRAAEWVAESIGLEVDTESLQDLPGVYRVIKEKGYDRRERICKECKKEITFFYTDRGEYYNLAPIAEEAEKRGYKTKFTANVEEKAEIGIYCQHICNPENSKISMILLHDMAQGHNRWPDIWNIERWNGFDIGIVPGKEWANRWSKCAVRPYANPRLGVFEAGYPKGDFIFGEQFAKRAEELKNKLHLKYPHSVLYAPSWENDEKEDDFILACQSLNLNLLIKQADWSEKYAPIIQNIQKMRERHEGKYENVYYIEPEENIMSALAMCDFVVSDESSVMIEAMLLHKPSIAVTDWMIPDTDPARPASMPFDCVLKCKKVQLREMAEKLLGKIEAGEPAGVDFDFFSNMGKCNETIVNLLDYALGETDETESLKLEVKPQYMPEGIWGI